MSIYNVDKLVEDARRKFARCVSAEELPLREVWDTLDRYIFSCMEQNHGLVVPNFGRFGWQVARRFRNNCVGPYFDFLDSFCRRYHVSISRRQAPALEVDLCRWEDFNFSKAALCFSRKLTKDHVSVGLGVLVYQIGQAITQGRPLSLDFRVGKLVSSEHGSSIISQRMPLLEIAGLVASRSPWAARLAAKLPRRKRSLRFQMQCSASPRRALS